MDFVRVEKSRMDLFLETKHTILLSPHLLSLKQGRHVLILDSRMKIAFSPPAHPSCQSAFAQVTQNA